MGGILFAGKKITTIKIMGDIKGFTRENCCCFSGHREIEEYEIAYLTQKIELATRSLIKKGIINFIAGGALGFDTICAKTVLRLKEEFPFIKLFLYLPCMKQDRYWSEKNRYIYRSVIENADKVVYAEREYTKGCMLKRNRQMVDDSAYILYYLKKEIGGTKYTVDYAIKQGLQILNVEDF